MSSVSTTIYYLDLVHYPLASGCAHARRTHVRACVTRRDDRWERRARVCDVVAGLLLPQGFVFLTVGCGPFNEIPASPQAQPMQPVNQAVVPTAQAMPTAQAVPMAVPMASAEAVPMASMVA